MDLQNISAKRVHSLAFIVLYTKSPVFFDWTSIVYNIFSVNTYIIPLIIATFSLNAVTLDWWNLPLAGYCFKSTRSARAIAVIASTTTGVLRAKHAS